jgi:hypothetical protein
MGVTLDGTLNGISLLSISETAGLGMKAGDVLVPQFENKQVESFTYTKSGAANDSEIDVISGEHGFYPAKYSTFDAVWLDELTTQLSVMYNKGSGAVSFFNSPSGDGTYSWSALQNRMQQQYDATKNS